ncbi:BAG family molecular chaperone regulator 1 [Platanthera guangdongensis]|uniref:BAG family molecular chaperone regulator 1 n=1 Tax=Platanthera guangdongensis TaxID=2320717 RepID=A0ABR2MGL0_9ASPA
MEFIRLSRFDGGSRGAGKEMKAEMDWEMRPGGMLVQKRLVDNLTPPPPMISLRISFGESQFEISVDSRATFSKFFSSSTVGSSRFRRIDPPCVPYRLSSIFFSKIRILTIFIICGWIFSIRNLKKKTIVNQVLKKGGNGDCAGELKKELEAKTGLRLGEQRVIYRGKVRENGEFLDRCGVKDRSKLVVMEDPSSLERRHIEMLRDARMQSTSRAIAGLSLEVDKLGDQVAGNIILQFLVNMFLLFSASREKSKGQ